MHVPGLAKGGGGRLAGSGAVHAARPRKLGSEWAFSKCMCKGGARANFPPRGTSRSSAVCAAWTLGLEPTQSRQSRLQPRARTPWAFGAPPLPVPPDAGPPRLARGPPPQPRPPTPTWHQPVSRRGLASSPRGGPSPGRRGLGAKPTTSRRGVASTSSQPRALCRQLPPAARRPLGCEGRCSSAQALGWAGKRGSACKGRSQGRGMMQGTMGELEGEGHPQGELRPG